MRNWLTNSSNSIWKSTVMKESPRQRLLRTVNSHYHCCRVVICFVLCKIKNTTNIVFTFQFYLFFTFVFMSYGKLATHHPSRRPIMTHAATRAVMMADTVSWHQSQNNKLSWCWQTRATRLEVNSRSPNSSIPYVRYSFLLCNSNFVFTIFDFNKCRDLEIRVRGHSRSLKVAPFDRLCMVSY